METHCDSFESFVSYEKRTNYDRSLPHPNNMLRNIALSRSNTPYVFMIDIDMVPSKDLHEQFQHFIKRHNAATSKDEKLVYVIPAFEAKTDFKIESKDSLLAEWDANNIQPFYKTVCGKCQKVTDYNTWQGLPALQFLDIGYTVDYEFPWEPFYIGKKDGLPLYDGKFKQYGFNRISQVCELHVAGYQFAVLNNAFIVHRGYKEPGQFHANKNEENRRNKELFQQFKENLKERYPSSKNQC